ncbi:ATP-binding protein [Dyella sp. Tek66A03]|uniref:ATP-binding protein n=1 Tax=Dyella sp. Tek66A03 TaxID=3458298 RepID=UPI00403E40AB
MQIAFGPFCVDPAGRLLTNSGDPREIGGRALDLLIALLERPGTVLSKRELLKQVWPDAVVEEGSLRFHMTQLRRILGDGVDGARYIATQVGVGYAFVAPVSKTPRASSPPDSVVRADGGFGHPVRNASHLPPRPRLIGRDEDARLVVDRLRQPALFAIVGPGGMGKTSLAVEVAHRISAERDGRVAFVDLAQVEDAALVLSAVAGVLGIPVQAEDPLFVLLAHLRTQTLLLVIDNCEHVVDTVSALAERIRDEAPGVSLLTTSREPLRARGEQVHWLKALDFPAETAGLSVDRLLAFPAVRLFVERASAGNASFAVDAADAYLIADMCRRLNGMALAIELAAVRVATHGLQTTHAMLGERFSLGWLGRRTALPRQQTLRATLDWSYGLLSPVECLMFDRLAIFVGPFSLQAASQVAADAQLDTMTAAATLDELAAKGLVSVDHSDMADSYRLLEMTRAYAREKLAIRGEAEMHALAFRHAAFHTELLAGLGSSPVEVFDGVAGLANQLGNIRSALEWSFGPRGDAGLALPLAAASAPLFLHFSLLIECRTWCSRATELLELGYHGTPAELELQAALGFVLMFTRGNSAAAEKALLRAMQIAVALGDHWSQLRLLGRLQIFYERIGDFGSSLAWAEQAIDVGNAIGEAEAIGVAASLAGVSHHLLGNQQLAREELEKALRHSLPSRRSRTIHYGFDHRNRTGLALARTLWLQGFPDQARRWADQVESEAAALEHPVTHCIALVWTLCIYIWTGDLDKAAKSLQTFEDIAQANAFGPYIAASRGMRGAIAIRAGETGDAVSLLEESLAQLHGMRYELLNTSFEIALAEGLILAGEHARALAVMERTIEHSRSSGDAFALPELLRIKAVTLKALHPADTAPVIAMLGESLALSRQQGARAWERRTTMELARLAQEQGRASEARELLQACRDAVSEGFDTMDLRQLERLLHQAGVDEA